MSIPPSIRIVFVPEGEMRYDTCGDWFYDDDDLVIMVSDKDREGHPYINSNERFLVALHELVEAWLCRHRGISQGRVDEFDANFVGDPALVPSEEPGDHPDSPYRREHRFAMLIEHLMALELGLDHYGEVW